MHAGKKTKIIATIGPSSEESETIKRLITAGVNVFRFNMKHNTLEWHVERIKRVQQASTELKVTVGILIDLQGPEVRLENQHQKAIDLETGRKILFVEEFHDNASYPSIFQIKIPQKSVIESLSVGEKFSIDDGYFEFQVLEKGSNYILTESLDAGLLKDRKSLNLIGKDVDLPSLTEGDMQKLDIGAKAKVDFVALSYVRTKEDVLHLRVEMDKRNLKAKIVSKIESEKGVDNIDEIIEESNIIMVARGDLGVEMPIEKIAFLQKEIVKKCRLRNKQVIVATQMLQSMVDSPRPTRAEATDVSNAVYDGADAVMLSGESASGKYPVKAVETMRRILKFNESKTNNDKFSPEVKDQTNAIVRAAMSLIHEKMIKIDKILVFTETGYTVNVLSSYHSDVPIIAISDTRETIEGLTLNYGVMPYFQKFPTGDFIYSNVEDQLKTLDIVEKGETVLVIHGRQWHDPGKTNALVVFNA